MFWTVLGYVLLGLLILFLLILLLPSVVYIEWRDGFSLKLRVLFVKLTLYPFPFKAREKKPRRKRGKKKEAPQEESKPKPEKSLEDRLELVRKIASSANAGMRFVLRFMRVYDVEFAAIVHAGEAGDLALRYGKLQWLLGTVRAMLENILHIRYKRLELVPDFADKYENTILFSCKIAAAPIILVIALILGITRFLRYDKAPKQKTATQRSEQHGQQ